MEQINNKVYASNGRQSFPCAGVFALKKGAKGANILVNYSLDGGPSDGNFSYVGGSAKRQPEEKQYVERCLKMLRELGQE